MARRPTLPLRLLLLAVASGVCLLPAGSALRCYHCESRAHAACRDPFFPRSAPLEECSHPQQMCVKITYYAESRDWVERRCAFMGGSASWRSGHVYTCGHDGCNAATRGARRSLLLMLALPVAAVAIW